MDVDGHRARQIYFGCSGFNMQTPTPHIMSVGCRNMCTAM